MEEKLTDTDKLQARIYAYEEGSTYESELGIAKNREEILTMLEQYGLKDEDGTPRVTEGEGQLIDEKYPEESRQVAQMRQEIRDFAAKRTGKVSERGEDVLPTLRKLQEFLQTPEGKEEGAYAKEVERLIDENKKSLKNIEAFQKDSRRVQELKDEIAAINEEMAKINDKVKEDPNFDAESIERTRLSVTLYHRQNELRGILIRNPRANETIDTSRATAKLENIISELEGIQKEQGVQQKDETAQTRTEEPEETKTPTGTETRAEEPEEIKTPTGTGTRTEEPEETKTPTGTGTRTEEPVETKTPIVEPKPEYKVGKVRGFFLSLVQKILSKVKPNGFLAKFFGGVESGLLLGAKPVSPKLTTVSEGTKVKASTKEKVPEESEVDINLEDSKWAMAQVSNVGNMDKNSLMMQIIKEALDKSKEDRKDIPDDKLPEFLEEEEIPVVLAGDEHAFNNLLYSNVVGNILYRAEKIGIPTKVKEGKTEKDRPISEIYADLERKHLQEKTNEVSKKAAEAKKTQDREEMPTPVADHSQEEEK
ncbi:MAG: hypothetical protein J6K45_04210 [Clostridia bacterium]|nr:hypothetical protein [Clostridia bacterium]